MAKSEKSKSKDKVEFKILSTHLENLPCELSQREFDDRANTLSVKLQEANAQEAYSKQVKDDLKAKESSIQAEIQRLAGIVRSRREPREVQVEEVAVYKDNEVRTIRKDTGEVIKIRPLEDHERQMSILDPEPQTVANRKAAQSEASDLLGELVEREGADSLAQGGINEIIESVQGRNGKMTKDERKDVIARFEHLLKTHRAHRGDADAPPEAGDGE